MTQDIKLLIRSALKAYKCSSNRNPTSIGTREVTGSVGCSRHCPLHFWDSGSIGNARYFRREICSVEVLASSSPFTGTPNLSRSKLRLGCCWKIKGFSRGGTSAPHRVDGYCGDCQRLKLGCWLGLSLTLSQVERGGMLAAAGCCAAIGLGKDGDIVFETTGLELEKWEKKRARNARAGKRKYIGPYFQCIQFSQFLHSGFDQRLAIPEIFTRHLGRKLPDTVNLKGPSGSAWKVGLTTYNNTLFFNHGWQEFVKDHALEENDFLIFKYNGESNFDVLMLNMQSMCEKVASYFVKKYESTERGNGCRTKRKTIKSSAEVVFASPKGVAGGSQPEEFIENDTDAIPGGQPNDSRVTGKKICRGIKSTEATEEDVVRGFQQVECSYNDFDTITPLNQPTREEIETEPGQPVDTVLHHARRGRKVTEQEKRNAMQLAVRAVTANGFLILMKPTHVCRKFFMAIPSAWIVKRIPIKGNQDVILCFKDRAWHTRFFYRKSRDNGGLSAGWKKFALDNKLHEFDVCVFEPLDLAIPEIFTRHLGRKLPDTVNLKGPSGSAWKVGLTTYNNTLFFNHGWQEFVKDHALEENDFLIFKYNGESNFDVLMLNMQSMCEKVASYFVKKYESTERGNGCRTKRKTIKSSTEVVFASPKGVAGGSQPEEFIENDTDAIPGGQPNDSRVTGKKICRGIKSTEATEEDVVGGFQQVECSYNDFDTITPLNQPTREEIETEPGQPVDTVLHHARRGRKVTEQEKRNAMQLAVRAVTANGFLILMKPTHVCRKFFMTIPSAWIVKRIPIKGNQDVILRFKDRAWHTRFFYRKSRDNGGLSAGWKKFALDNKLHEFDVCVFEPLDLVNCPIILNINIFRVVEEATNYLIIG
ncbi:BINDING PROTEIN putative-RELATED [Salix koriyanagi]|uniref:BINDING PROTEIN putative-RELATED n=1 Tax=Salix koriyanagi TaxID=2511006 RepID=A0A9Q0TDW4_9ROSI|nr:BINDING PROTEIN putative-RELATED [Salix koriyanagi]